MTNNTRDFLSFLISQLFENPESYTGIIPAIQGNFIITKPGNGIEDSTKECVDDVISWENGIQHASLEETLNDKYLIYKRK